MQHFLYLLYPKPSYRSLLFFYWLYMNAMLLIDRCDYIRNRTYRHSFTARAEVHQILLNHKRDCQEINNVELVRAFFVYTFACIILNAFLCKVIDYTHTVIVVKLFLNFSTLLLTLLKSVIYYI